MRPALQASIISCKPSRLDDLVIVIGADRGSNEPKGSYRQFRELGSSTMSANASLARTIGLSDEPGNVEA